MTQLPTDRTNTSTVAEHVSDHNILHAEHNELDGHAADTTSVHGITDTSALETTTGSAAKVAAHEADSTSVHGISDTAALYLTASHTKANHDSLGLSHDSLSDVSIDDHHARDHTLSGSTHTASGLSTGNVIRASGATTFAWAQLGHGDLGSVTSDQHHAQAHHAAHEPSGADPMAVDAAAATGSLRTLGTGAAQAATGNHAHSGTYEPSGTVATHAAAADPHTGYVLESLVDAAGDLIVGTANDTVGRFGLGSALQVLRVNAGATALEYATPASGGGTSPLYDFGMIR